MAEVRALARRLYGAAYGEWVEANYGVLCMECNQTLPAHSGDCGIVALQRILAVERPAAG